MHATLQQQQKQQQQWNPSRIISPRQAAGGATSSKPEGFPFRVRLPPPLYFRGYYSSDDSPTSPGPLRWGDEFRGDHGPRCGPRSTRERPSAAGNRWHTPVTPKVAGGGDCARDLGRRVSLSLARSLSPPLPPPFAAHSQTSSSFPSCAHALTLSLCRESKIERERET